MNMSKEVYKGYTIKISQDEDPWNPREMCDEMATMVTWHRNYNIGDDHNYNNPERHFYEGFWFELACELDPELAEKAERLENWLYDHNGSNEYEERVSKWVNAIIEKHLIYLPIYIYDHGGITINTTGFSCGWDSGLIGYIFVSKDTVRKEYCWKRITKKRTEEILVRLRSEISLYDQYLTGDVWCYDITDSNGNDMDDGSLSCIYGHKYAIEEAKMSIDATIAYNIKNGIPKNTEENRDKYAK
jgi:hypothetical protein